TDSSLLKRLAGNGLQRSLLLFVVLPIVLLTALGIRFGLGQASQFQEQRLKNDLELIGRAISLPVGNALNKGDMHAVELALVRAQLILLAVTAAAGVAGLSAA